MANLLCEVLLTEKPIDIGVALADPDSGAVVEFQGIVRRLEDGRELTGIDYEAHGAMAEHQMKLIAQHALKQFEVASVVLYHRIGFVPAGETSLWLRVGSQHRGPAFEAAVWIVADLKRKVPIWKRPRFEIDAASPDARRIARAEQMA